MFKQQLKNLIQQQRDEQHSKQQGDQQPLSPRVQQQVEQQQREGLQSHKGPQQHEDQFIKTRPLENLKVQELQSVNP